jgi:hypothetical protein
MNALGGVPDGLVPDGENPRAWRTAGGATASDEPGTWLGGLFGKATRIVDATGNFLSMVTSEDLPIFAGETLDVFLVYKAGTAVSLRLTLDIRDAGTPRWVYATGAPGDLDWQTLSIHTGGPVENIDFGDGVYGFQASITLGCDDPLANFGFGPGMNIPGRDVVLIGMVVTSRSRGGTAWVPQSKPVWFTELGCPAIDRGTNQPKESLINARCDAVFAA